jgi:hypothetical protein
VPAPAPDRGRFGSLWVAPYDNKSFQGAGLGAGYRYSWLAGVYRAGFMQTGYEPLQQGMALQRTRRVLAELEVDGQIRLGNVITMAVGAGGAFMSEHVDTATPGVVGSTADRGRLRGLVTATLVGPLFEIDVTTYLQSNPEIRISLGVCIGRHVRR